MPLPKKIKVGHQDYILTSESGTKILRHTDNAGGICSDADAEITWASDHPQAPKILIHEVLHAIDRHWNVFEDDVPYEKYITSLAEGLACVMRDNPDVFKMILKELSK